jgi:hypothetical protein
VGLGIVAVPPALRGVTTPPGSLREQAPFALTAKPGALDAITTASLPKPRPLGDHDVLAYASPERELSRGSALLADPAPILHTLMTDPLLASRYRLDGVVTTVDGVNGASTLDNHEEAVKQAAVADRILLTKVDIADAPKLAELKHRLAHLNPGAPFQTVEAGEIDPNQILNAGLYNPDSKTADVKKWLQAEAYEGSHDHGHGHHHHGHGCVERHTNRSLFTQQHRGTDDRSNSQHAQGPVFKFGGRSIDGADH